MFQLYLLLSWIGNVYSDIIIDRPSSEEDTGDMKVDMTTKCIFAALWGITMCTCLKCQSLHGTNKKKVLRKNKDIMNHL
jgi:hypothetical protein